MTTDEIGPEPIFRDDDWLAERVSLLRQIHFADVPQGYPITTRFGIRARNRFGSIGAKAKRTIILVNRLFADTVVPTYVVDGTLAHELAHYAHGYGSGLPLLYKDPHRGGIVDKELDRRGLGQINEKAEHWRKTYWDDFYLARCADLDARRMARAESVNQKWSLVLNRAGSRSEAELRSRLSRMSPQFGFSEPPYRAEWLRATARQTAPSYWFSQSRTVRVHGLLADARVPLAVLEYEIGYWLARRAVGDNPHRIHQALCLAGLDTAAGEAVQWRRRSWNAFRTRNHPLASK